jgi:hypothetical protein
MKERRALLDIASHTVQVKSLDHGIVVIQLSSPSITTPSIHHITVPNLRDILIVREFPDVFPDDLPGMPPDQDVEFTTELQPSMTGASFKVVRGS